MTSSPSRLTTGFEPEEKGVTPPGVKLDAGLTATGCDQLFPPSPERATKIGEPRECPLASDRNSVHVTYTVPVRWSTVTHSLSLKTFVGSELPMASTPSR